MIIQKVNQDRAFARRTQNATCSIMKSTDKIQHIHNIILIITSCEVCIWPLPYNSVTCNSM